MNNNSERELLIALILLLFTVNVAAEVTTTNNCVCGGEIGSEMDSHFGEGSGNGSSSGNNMTACNQLEILLVNKLPASCAPADPHDLISRLSSRNLQHLGWHSTSLTAISNHTLVGILNVRHLNLSLNAISILHPDAFRHLLHLNVLDLSHNRISTLPIFLLASNSMLTHVSLARNLLATLDLALNTKALALLDASHNFLTALDLKHASSRQRSPNNLSLVLDHNHLGEVSVHPAFQTGLLSVRENGMQSLKPLARMRPLLMETLDLEQNHVIFLDLTVLGRSTKVKQLLLAGNELETLDVATLSEHFPKLESVSVRQRSAWLCSDLRRLVAALQQRHVRTRDSNGTDSCFEPQSAILELQKTFMRKYATLLAVFGTTTTLLLAVIVVLAMSTRRSLRRMRADSLSKSFDIKMAPSMPLPMPPIIAENVYEENVYNHVYSDPTPTTTL